MNYQLYRMKRKPLKVASDRSSEKQEWEKVNDEQVIASFPPGIGIDPQRFAATMFKNRRRGIMHNGANYSTLDWAWRVEKICNCGPCGPKGKRGCIGLERGEIVKFPELYTALANHYTNGLIDDNECCCEVNTENDKIVSHLLTLLQYAKTGKLP